MTTSSRLTAEQRRALAMLASAGRDGATQQLLTARGLGVSMVTPLVNQGLAIISYERVRPGGDTVEVDKVRITDKGREVLGES
jgi:hypothetical protein